jgi:hypothetical protein
MVLVPFDFHRTGFDSASCGKGFVRWETWDMAKYVPKVEDIVFVDETLVCTIRLLVCRQFLAILRGAVKV